MHPKDGRSDVQWPPLEQRYLGALQTAVDWILSTYTVSGIVACGSIIRGNPGPTSDFDIYVVHAAPERQRVQRVFDGVPAEIFVNPPAAIRHYFALEHAAYRPCTAHMLSHGFVVLERDPVVGDLLAEAATWLAKSPPTLTADQRVMARYFAADQLDNARDLLDTDPENAELLLHTAVRDMLLYLFKAAGRYLPRDKELITATAALDPTAGDLVSALYQAHDVSERLRLAHALGDRILDATGFFPWESTPDIFPAGE